ncbi:hypothetical protein OIV83_004860 [Microbotryomycetes sp. JL201]|nr:hypothetical protein OIV83_004860 [Microbotryomycetes sp. JL201]
MQSNNVAKVVLVALHLADGSTAQFLSRHADNAQTLSRILKDVEEREYVLQYRRLVDRQRSLAGKLLARYVISTEYGIEWHAIAFEREANGRPRAAHELLQDGFDFNIAHDGDWVVLVAFVPARGQVDTVVQPHRRVGVDVMEIAIPWQESTNDCMRINRVMTIWTLKEAYTKAMGEGLKADLTKIQFSAPAGTEHGATCSVNGHNLDNWTFRTIQTNEDYIVAVAVNEKDAAVPDLHVVTLTDLEQAMKIKQ